MVRRGRASKTIKNYVGFITTVLLTTAEIDELSTTERLNQIARGRFLIREYQFRLNYSVEQPIGESVIRSPLEQWARKNKK